MDAAFAYVIRNFKVSNGLLAKVCHGGLQVQAHLYQSESFETRQTDDH